VRPEMAPLLPFTQNRQDALNCCGLSSPSTTGRGSCIFALWVPIRRMTGLMRPLF